MFYINNFKLFESKKRIEKNKNITSEEFIDKFLDKKLITYNRLGEIIYDGPVLLSNKGLSQIPVKFAKVNCKIDVSNNKLKNFDFLPEEVSNTNRGMCQYAYYINGNDFGGNLLRVMNIIRSLSSEKPEIFISFIKECLTLDVWSNGSTNEIAIEESWIYAKLEFYNSDKDRLIKKFPEILDFNDEEILKDYYSLKEDNWEEELLENLINSIKDGNHLDPNWIPTIKVLFHLIKNDDSEDIRDIIEGKYGLTELYKRSKSLLISKWNEFAQIIKGKLNRNDDQIDRDESHDLFVFIGSYEFVEKDGRYDKVLDIERLVRMDLYNEEKLSKISRMQLRARFNNKDVYMIWIPKETFKEEKAYYDYDEIPEFLIGIIDKHKTRI